MKFKTLLNLLAKLTEMMKIFTPIKKSLSLGLTIEITIGIFAAIYSEANARSIAYGFCLLVVGFFFFLWMLSYQSQPNRAEQLFGPWKIVRHPQLLLALILNCAILVVARHAFIFAVAVVFFTLIYKRRLEAAEKILQRTFDTSIPQYRIEIPALFPSLSSLVEPPTGSVKMSLSVRDFSKKIAQPLTLHLAASVAIFVAIVAKDAYKRGLFF